MKVISVDFFLLRKRNTLFFFLSLFVFTSINSSAQIFWTETFGTGCSQGQLVSAFSGVNGAWTMTNVSPPSPFANAWYVSAQEQGMGVGLCGAGCGGAQNRTLHIGNVAGSPLSLLCPTGDCGATYDAGLGLGDVETNRRATTPVINCTGQANISLDFEYFTAGDPGNDFLTLEFSDDGGFSWSTLNVFGPVDCCGGVPCSGFLQGLWTTYSVTLPAAADNNPNVKIGFRWENNDDGAGTDPSIAVDNITLTSVPGIVTDAIFSLNYCACDTIHANFTSSGTFTGGNTYTLQMSDATGSFATPTSIGTLVSTANSGTIVGTIPCGTPAGSNYRFRVVSNSPVITGTDNGTDITINSTFAAAVSISASPSTSICSGASVTFTAVNTNGIPSPNYQWFVNGGAVGTNSSTYTTTTLVNGDNVTCQISSATSCVTGSPATSNTLTISIIGVGVNAVVTITASQNPICTGTNVVFSATNVNGIASPNYQWQVNGVNVGTNSPTYNNAGLANGNIVTCIISSAAPCVLGSPATSNAIIMTVGNTFTASVTLSVSPNDTICVGDAVTFTATPVFGGPSPTYAWTLNAAPVGSNSPTYSNSSLVNGDVIVCTMTSSLPCAAVPAVATITMTVDPGGVTSCTIVSSPDTACPGQMITFTATSANSGSNPSYQWYVNGVPVGSNNPLFLSNTLNSGDFVTCEVTSSSWCSTGSPAASNAIAVLITNTLNADVIISTNWNPSCQGDSVTVFAVPVNGGNDPLYFWQVNGVIVGTNEDHYTGVFNNNDIVTCSIISSDPCAFNGFPIQSLPLTLQVDPCPVPVSMFSKDATIICQEQCVQFKDSSENNPVGWHWTFEGGQPGESYDKDPVPVCYPASGTYSVSLITTNQYGSHDTTYTGVIKVDDPDPITASEDVEIQKGMSTNLTATGGNMYNWTPVAGLSCNDCADPVATPETTTDYVVSDTLGCPSSDTIHVKVFEKYEIYVPNAFSPNGDSENDVLFVRGNGIVDIQFIIYDRIGEKVYSSGNKEQGWDGTFRGKLLDPGVFSYYVKASMMDGSTQSQKGNVTLFR